MGQELAGGLVRILRVVRIGLIAVAVAFVVFCAYAWALFLTAETRLQRAAARFEREVGPLDLAHYVLGPVPDDENAAGPIRRALELLPHDAEGRVEPGRFEAVHDCASRGTEALDEATRQRVRTDLASNSAALDEFALAVDRKQSNWDIPFADLARKGFPRFTRDSTALYDLAACDAWIAMMDGDESRALLRLESVFRLSESFRNEPELSPHLFGIAHEKAALVLLSEMLQRPEIELDRLERALPLDDAYAHWRRSFAARSAQYNAWADRLHSEAKNALDRKWTAVGRVTGLERELEFVNAADRSRAEAAAVAPASAFSFPILKLFEDKALDLRSLDNTLALTTRRAMARRAIALIREARRTGAYALALEPPSTAEDDPLGERPLAYTVHEDGSAMLSAPGAIEILRDRSRFDRRELEWRLPAPRGTNSAP